MSDAYEEYERLRLDATDDADDETRREEAGETGAPAGVATVVNTGTTAGAFYTLQPVAALGTETEGAAGSISSQGGTILALNVGTAIPTAGTKVIYTWVPYRWVFQHDG